MDQLTLLFHSPNHFLFGSTRATSPDFVEDWKGAGLNLASAIPTNSEMMALIFLNKLLFPDVEEEGVVNQTKQSIATMFTVFL